jgi:hypothetical protein
MFSDDSLFRRGSKLIKKNAWSVAALACAVLAGCGGGGSDNGHITAASALAGGWVGSASSGDTTQAVVLEDGTLYAINGSPVGGLIYINSFDKATLRLSGNGVSATDLREYSFPDGSFVAGTVAGTFTAGSSLNFTATANNGGPSAQVNLQPAPRTNYDYDTPATLAAVQGNWPGSFSTGDSGTVAVSANGNFSATTALGCQLSGSIQPRASGKNVYDVSVQFGASPCALPGATVTGHGFITHPDSGGTQFAVAVTTSDRSLGAAFFSTR